MVERLVRSVKSLDYSRRALVKFIKGDGCGCGDVERVDMVVHRYFDHIVAGVDGLQWETFPLGAHDDGEFGFALQPRIVYVDGIMAQSHGNGLEPKLPDCVHIALEPCPGNQKH